jgi:RNA polymerase subunit RPABC4/transcription elongation factor Spt4
MTQRKSSFRDEFGIIPEFMLILAGIGFAAMMYVFLDIIEAHDPHAPPFPARLFMGALCGCVVAVYLMLVGYVNQDAKRRDMGQLLWTLMVIFIPNGIGFLAYFLLRKPLIEACPRCHERVEKGFHFCPKCGYALQPTCGQCGQPVSSDYVCCPYCGKQLTTPKPIG